LDYAFLVGAMPRKEGMERKDLLAANVKIFKSQGRALAKYSKPTVKVQVLSTLAVVANIHYYFYIRSLSLEIQLIQTGK
jgi:malate dehydrogenase